MPGDIRCGITAGRRGCSVRPLRRLDASAAVTARRTGNNLEPAPAPTPASLLVTHGTASADFRNGRANTAYSVGQIIQPATIVQGGVMNV